MLATYTLDRMKKIKVRIRQAYYFLCYQYAHIITHLWGNWRLYTLKGLHNNYGYTKTLCFLWGRRESPEPIRCKDCGWAGMVRWLVHTYEYDGFDDVEPVDYCPRCKGYI